MLPISNCLPNKENITRWAAFLFLQDIRELTYSFESVHLNNKSIWEYLEELKRPSLYLYKYIEKSFYSQAYQDMFVKINSVFYTMCDSTPVVVTYSILHTRVIKLDFETGMQIALEKY